MGSQTTEESSENSSDASLQKQRPNFYSCPRCGLKFTKRAMEIHKRQCNESENCSCAVCKISKRKISKEECLLLEKEKINSKRMKISENVDHSVTDSLLSMEDSRSISVVDTLSLMSSEGYSKDSRSISVVDTVSLMSTDRLSEDSRSISVVDTLSLMSTARFAEDSRSISMVDTVSLMSTDRLAEDSRSRSISMVDTLSLMSTDRLAEDNSRSISMVDTVSLMSTEDSRQSAVPRLGKSSAVLIENKRTATPPNTVVSINTTSSFNTNGQVICIVNKDPLNAIETNTAEINKETLSTSGTTTGILIDKVKNRVAYIVKKKEHKIIDDKILLHRIVENDSTTQSSRDTNYSSLRINDDSSTVDDPLSINDNSSTVDDPLHISEDSSSSIDDRDKYDEKGLLKLPSEEIDRFHGKEMCSRKIFCIICGEHMLWKEFTMHVLAHCVKVERKNFRCPLCSDNRSSATYFLMHFYTHISTHPPECEECKCSNPSCLLNDEAPHAEHCYAESMDHRCYICLRYFGHFQTLINHMRRHAEELPFYCKECPRSFRQIGNLQRHMATHQGTKPFTCNKCSRSFADPATLRNHHRVHTKETPYVCGSCNRGFSQIGNLKRHMALHVQKGVRTSYIKVVDKDKNKTGAVQEEVAASKPEETAVAAGKLEDSAAMPPPATPQISTTVTEVKPKRGHRRKGDSLSLHICHMCGKKYTWKHDLDIHFRTHTGEKPYHCDLCPKRFAQSGAVRIHKLRHHATLDQIRERLKKKEIKALPHILPRIK